ncbi:MAG: MlaD family protein [Bacteroidales bacterium]
MRISSEVKIGITGVVTVIVIIWGINFLKGRNIFSSNYTLIATYDQVDGLEPSAKIMMNGFKIGSVERIIFDTEALVPFTLFMEIDNNYRISTESVAEIYNADLLGSKAVKIIQSGEHSFHEEGDTLKSRLAGDMVASLLAEITPLISHVNTAVQTLDSVGVALSHILNDPAVSSMIGNIEKATGKLDQQLSENGDLAKSFENIKTATESIGSQNESIRNTLKHLEGISSRLDNGNLDSMLYQLNSVSSHLAGITSNMKEGKGTIGKLIYEDSLYQQIGQLISDLDSLVTDLNNNPKKYVSFSLIGR